MGALALNYYVYKRPRVKHTRLDQPDVCLEVVEGKTTTEGNPVFDREFRRQSLREMPASPAGGQTSDSPENLSDAGC